MLQSGHKVEHLSDKDDERQKKFLKGYDRTITLQPGGWCLPDSYLKKANDYLNFKVDPQDVYIVTYPKCGTTWTTETVWTMRNNANFDNPEAANGYFMRVPFVEFDFIVDNSNIPTYEEHSPELIDSIQKKCPGKKIHGLNMFYNLADCAKQPRSIKSHLPIDLLPPNLLDVAKVVYVIRSPKDACFSYCHHHKLFKMYDFSGTVEDFAQMFMDDQIMYSPYWGHIYDAWKHRQNKNICFFSYEKFQKDRLGELRRLDTFLNTNLTDSQLEKVAEHTKFSNMKARYHLEEEDDIYTNKNISEKEGGFFREGKRNEGKEKMSEETNEKMDVWIEENSNKFGKEFKDFYNDMMCIE